MAAALKAGKCVGYPGVTQPQKGKKWMLKIAYQGENIGHGVFSMEEEEAARAHDDYVAEDRLRDTFYLFTSSVITVVEMNVELGRYHTTGGKLFCT